MANYQLAVETRDKLGSASVRKMRRSNLIPAVIYGSGKPALPISVDLRSLEKALTTSGSLIDLAIGAEKKTVIVKDVQMEPVKGSILHVDFHEVALDRKLETVVPIRIINEDARPNDGGMVATLLWELAVTCLPADIPEAIEVDVQNLEVGSTLLVKDLSLPAGVEAVTDAEEAVVKVDARTGGAADAEEEAEGTTAEETETAE